MATTINNTTDVTKTPVSDGIEILGRIGYMAKGIIYSVVGILATQAAFTSGGKTTGSKGAIRDIASQPFGRVMLGIICLGLIGYVTWRFVQCFLDPEGKGDDAKAIAKRVGYGISGVAYASLAFLAGSIALGNGGSQGSGDSKADWTAFVLGMPFGQWIVGLVGLIVIAVGLYNLKKAITARFMEKYDVSMTETARKVALVAGRGGLAARCVTFVIIGTFLGVAAYQADPDETKGLSGALQTLAEQPYGPWLLGTVAIGVIAYGIHCFVNAKYRSFEV